MARYKPNHSMRDGLGGFMMDPSKTGRIALLVAEKVKAQARLNVLEESNNAEDNEDGQHLADNFEVVSLVAVLNENPPNPRRAAGVYNGTRYMARWEFGAAPGHKGAHHSLRRAGAKYGELRGDIG